MWQKYFKLVGLLPGRVVVQGHGTIDFSKDNIPVEVCKDLFEKDFRYLEITEAGKAELYGLKTEPVIQEVKQEIKQEVKRRKRHKPKTDKDTE